MPPAFASYLARMRSLSFSIGQLTFGSFLVLLAVIAATSMASVIAIRQIDSTFAELQRLQGVGDLAEEIDRRLNELRLAARDFVNQGVRPDRVGEAARALNELLKKTRLELAPEQQAMIDGVSGRLQNYREGIERVTALITRRADLITALPPARDRFEQAIAAVPDQAAAKALLAAHNELTAAVLAHDAEGAQQAAQRMRTLPIDDPSLRSAADSYADAITAISGVEAEIAKLDKEVLGTEGRLIGRVTELLRELSARQGRVLSRHFARTLVEADTAREAAVHALAEQRLAEESYRKLFEGSVDGIYVTTPAGALLNANPALAQIMGYDTPEELIRDIGDITQAIYVHPAAR